MNLGSLFYKVATDHRKKSGIPDPPSTEERQRAADAAAGDEFAKRNLPLLSALNEGKIEFAQKILAYLRIHAPTERVESREVVSAYCDLALFKLIENGSLHLVTPAPPEALARLQQLQKSLEDAGLIAPVAPAAAAAAVAEPDPIDQCAADYISLPSRPFRTKWMTGANRAIYDQAVLTGRI